MTKFVAYVVNDDGTREPIDMKEVRLTTIEEVRKWVWVDKMNPGYMATHPELEGKKIEVVEEEGEEYLH